MARFLKALFLLAAAVGCGAVAAAESIRLKDIGKFAGWRENALVGYGLVTGLAGTGDTGANKATRQSVANMLGRFDTVVTPEQLSSRNVAAVMVTANLAPFAAEGNTLDVTVTSIGDARSLTGGTLLLTPLKAPNGKTYALAQGPLSVGGYKYDMNGNVVQKNHPTVGSIPGGATVEVSLKDTPSGEALTFLLDTADHTTASRIAMAINRAEHGGIALPRNAGAVEIRVPADQQARMTDFIARLENLGVEPDQRARVVVNERTGTVVSGGDVRINKVAISHGDLKVSITTENSVSQPLLVRDTGADVRTAVVSNSTVDVKESNESGIVVAGQTTVTDLIRALARVKLSTRDIISVLRAVKAAGAMHADLVIQ
jgi:flagellar P-ring protein precursor FlgI